MEFGFLVPNPSTSSTPVAGLIASNAVITIVYTTPVFGFAVAANSNNALNVFPVINW